MRYIKEFNDSWDNNRYLSNNKASLGIFRALRRAIIGTYKSKDDLGNVEYITIDKYIDMINTETDPSGIIIKIAIQYGRVDIVNILSKNTSDKVIKECYDLLTNIRTINDDIKNEIYNILNQI